MKPIKPIKFSAENEQIAKENNLQVNRMPQSGSGSGSGGDVSYSESGGGHGTIQSSFGGSWDVDSSFIWSAKLTYEKIVDIDVTIVTKAEISVDKVQLSCGGIPSGTKKGGNYYEPFSLFGIVGGSQGFTFESSSGLMDVDCSMDSLPQELKVTITRYDNEGEKISSTIKEEKISINIQMTFFC